MTARPSEVNRSLCIRGGLRHHGVAMKPFQRMRTEQECLAIAIEMEARAEQSLLPGQVADLRYMAKCWRSLGRHPANIGSGKPFTPSPWMAKRFPACGVRARSSSLSIDAALVT